MSFDATQKSYKALRAIVAERTHPLVLWIGAGLSTSAGIPSWSELRDHLAQALDNKADSLPPREASRAQRVAQASRAENNLWLAFEILHKNLGSTTFRDEVKAVLRAAPTVQIPESYSLLTQLRIRGLLNLNLDRLATRAFGSRSASNIVVEHSGRSIARLHNVLTEPSLFIGNLHGAIEDTSSWVFTKSQLDQLLGDESYQSFIAATLSTHTVIFLGLTADDLAIGGHLERLTRLEIELPTHYWLTNRRDAGTDFWAEQAGIRVIRYQAVDGDHSPVAEFLRDLVSATPADDPPAPPVALDREADAKKLPPPANEMLSWDADRIRESLNAYATELLADDSDTGKEAYDRFWQEYDQVIFRAWYVDTRAGSSKLLGYTLEKEIAKGSFGRVYRALDPEGKRVAVKVLLESVRNEPRMLHSFRRGVHSMRILSRRGVQGMVAYNEASEIPAFVAMEWIEGPNLTEAKASGYIGDWQTILAIALGLAKIIRDAHALPERVLHRDIRPSNVMLKDYYDSPTAYTVVVLDFDLSWHRNAYEVSVLHSTSAGYLAPEQLRHTSTASTRNAVVDSFGLGMTFLFLCTGVDPLPDEHRHEDWTTTVKTACDKIATSEWASVPERFARLIVSATEDEQSRRWDVAEIENELERLYLAVVKPDKITAPDLLAEELASRTECMVGYSWSPDALRAETTTPTGLRYAIAADLQNERVTLAIDWTATGVEDRQGLEKYVKAGAETAVARLRAAGWRDISDASEGASVHVDAIMDASALSERLSDVAKRIDRAVEKLRFGPSRN